MTANDFNWKIGIPGFLQIEMGPNSTRALGQVWKRQSKFSGQCIIVDRWSGLALDSTPDPHRNTEPVMWTVHGDPWQRWRIIKLPSKKVLIASEIGGLVLTTENAPTDGSRVWLDSYRGYPQQQWQLTRSDDQRAFQIESVVSAHALDADYSAKLPAAGEGHSISDPSKPLMWTNWNGGCQQWTIARPL
ncbi:RICIN domain-containing protein [Nocardia sp. NPDC057227]|uniref:RICIN domain-containing protein n=1 Tax=Nocardia sp. NPDC057227 TaxID=3346056 RepID=UPI0036331B94